MSKSSPDEIYKIRTEEEMLFLGEKIGKILKSELPKVVELIGDVGVGKTTLTRGIAKGLGVQDPVTSPSFTISKQYAFNLSDDAQGTLVHYDFYRLSDPGIMQEDLLDKIALPSAITIVEWGQTVAGLLPSSLAKITITLNDDESRTVTTSKIPQGDR